MNTTSRNGRASTVCCRQKICIAFLLLKPGCLYSTGFDAAASSMSILSHDMLFQLVIDCLSHVVFTVSKKVNVLC